MATMDAYSQTAVGNGMETSTRDDIIPRDIHFDIRGNATRHWFEGDIIKTIMIDIFSIFLPEGERFFILSLKHFASTLGNQELANEIRGYTIQEAFHTREHEDYNQAMATLGYDVASMELPIRYALERVKNPLHRLAITCAIEHMTATFSTITLREPKLIEGAAPAYRRLWMWHALEELEHKAVALDVLKAAMANRSRWKRYLLRIVGMNATLIPFVLLFLRNVPVYARADGVKTGVRFWLRFCWVVLFAPGYLGRSIIPLMRYYLPNFDPRNSDDRELVRKGRLWLDRDMATVV
jgi:predicted metal-dependent hydrolase